MEMLRIRLHLASLYPFGPHLTSRFSQQLAPGFVVERRRKITEQDLPPVAFVVTLLARARARQHITMT